jgi:hypothetical protein
MLSCAKEESPLVVAFWDGKSKGTKNMIEIAKAEGMEIHVVLVE